jgi:hypothetical protein
MRAAIYARVSTFDQEPENQLQELRRYVEARGWTAAEYVDRGGSGAKDRRPALDDVIRDAKRRRFDVLVCWRLDRLGRNLKHLITSGAPIASTHAKVTERLQVPDLRRPRTRRALSRANAVSLRNGRTVPGVRRRRPWLVCDWPRRSVAID